MMFASGVVKVKQQSNLTFTIDYYIFQPLLNQLPLCTLSHHDIKFFINITHQLTSGCDAWWGLSAMPTHYFSQCLPTPLSWYYHLYHLMR